MQIMMFCQSSEILFEPIKTVFTNVYFCNKIYEISDGKEYVIDKKYEFTLAQDWSNAS